MTEDGAEINHQLISECLSRISSGDKNAAFDLAQFYLARVVKKDVWVMLSVVEGLARQSAKLGSKEAGTFLEKDWPELRAVFERRLNRVFKPDSDAPSA